MNTTQDINDVLASNYMLVTLSISRWSASKPDKALAAEAAALHGATPEAFSATRKLMAGADGELKAINKVLNSIRTYLYTNTVPWSNNDEGMLRGPRLLLASKAMETIKTMGMYQKDLNAAKDSFKNVYMHRVQEALAKQGDLADAALYPPEDQILSMFDARFDIQPVPMVSSFAQMNIPANLATALGDREAERQLVKVKNAQADLHQRIIEAVGRMATQLGKFTAGEKTRLFASLVGNIKQLGELLEDSNFFNDPAIDALRQQLAELSAHDIEQIKNNAGLAQSLATKANAIVGGNVPTPVEEPDTNTALSAPERHMAPEPDVPDIDDLLD